MTNQKHQSAMESFSKRRIQSQDEELLKDILGGAGSLGSSPVATAKSLKRSMSAPELSTKKLKLERASPTVDRPNNHPLQSRRIHPNPPKVRVMHDRAIVDGITRLFN